MSPVLVSPYIEKSTDTLHSGDCFLMTSRSLTKPAEISTKKKVLDCMYIVHTQSCLTLQPHQAPRSIGFSRQEHWCGLAFPPPEDLPTLGIEPTSSVNIPHFRWVLGKSHLGSPDFMYSPFSKINIYTVLAPYLFRGASQSYLGAISWAAVILPPKSLTRKSQVVLFFLSQQIVSLFQMYPTLLHVSSLTIIGTCLCFTPKMFPECSPLTWFANFYSCLNAQVLPVPQWCFLQLPQGNLTAPVDCHCLSLTWNLTHIMQCVSLRTWVVSQPRLSVSGT